MDFEAKQSNSISNDIHFFERELYALEPELIKYVDKCNDGGFNASHALNGIHFVFELNKGGRRSASLFFYQVVPYEGFKFVEEITNVYGESSKLVHAGSYYTSNWSSSEVLDEVKVFIESHTNISDI